MKEHIKLSKGRKEKDVLAEGLSSQVPLLTMTSDVCVSIILKVLPRTLTGWFNARDRLWLDCMILRVSSNPKDSLILGLRYRVLGAGHCSCKQTPHSSQQQPSPSTPRQETSWVLQY